MAETGDSLATRAAELYARINGADKADAQKALSEHFMRLNEPSYRAAAEPIFKTPRPAVGAAHPRQPVTIQKPPADSSAKPTTLPAVTQAQPLPEDLRRQNMAYGLGAGALTGGGLGLLYEALRSKTPEEKKQTFAQKALRYAAKGGIGAIAGGALGGRVGGSMAIAKTAAQAFGEKLAGAISEELSSFNPLNWWGGSLAGGAAALATPTRSLREQAEFDSRDGALRALTNVLVPGVGPYRGFKRIGAAIRSPEMKAIKARHMQDKAKRELESLQAAHGADEPQDKAAGWKTELLSGINPLNIVGTPLGAIAAGLTPTRTLNQQAEADDSTWSNVLIPGQGVYNYFKRIGAATRSPEMKAMRQRATMERLKRDAGMSSKQTENEDTADKAASAYSFGEKLALNLDALRQGGLGGAGVGAVLGGLHGALNPGEEETIDDNGRLVKRRRGRLGAALRGLAGGAAVGGAFGAGAGALAPDQVMSHVQNYGSKLRQFMENFRGQQPDEAGGESYNSRAKAMAAESPFANVGARKPAMPNVISRPKPFSMAAYDAPGTNYNAAAQAMAGDAQLGGLGAGKQPAPLNFPPVVSPAPPKPAPSALSSWFDRYSGNASSVTGGGNR